MSATDERLAQWWAEWWAEDYSWEGLGRRAAYGEPDKPWLGWSVPPEGEAFDVRPTHEAPEGWRPATLQDYWRHTGVDPETDLVTNVTHPDGTPRSFTRFHLPFTDGAGKPTEKAGWDARALDAFKSGVLDRLHTARETRGQFDVEIIRSTGDGNIVFRPDGADDRAQLQGVVAPELPALRVFAFVDPAPEPNGSGPPPTPKEDDGRRPALHIAARRLFLASAASFASCNFGHGADFQRATFSGYASFRSAAFSGNAYFQSAAFSGIADFQSAALSGNASFRSAAFSGYANFRSAAFSGYADFNSAAFAGDAYFLSAAFSGDANFESAAFSGNAYFQSAAFSGDADFQSAALSGNASFRSAAFSGYANFQSAAFSGYADFNSAAFAGDADFSGLAARLVTSEQRQTLTLARSGAEDFAGALVSPAPDPAMARRSFLKANFSGCWFDGDVDFSNRNMLGGFDLTEARFMGLAQFHGGAFHQDLRLKGARFRDVLDPGDWLRRLKDAARDFLYVPRPAATPPDAMLRRFYEASRAKGDEARSFERWREDVLRERAKARAERLAGRTDADFAAIESAFQTLKLGMESLRRRADEQWFHRLELLARRRRRDDRVPAWERVVSILYDLAADYGGSFVRPLIALLFIVLPGFALLYFASALAIDAAHSGALIDTPVTFAIGANWHPLFEQALLLSGELTFRPFIIWSPDSLTGDAGEDHLVSILLNKTGPLWSLGGRLVGTAQSFISLMLIFLSGLAIRRRFQIN